MKRAAITISAILLIQGWAFAHEGENHTKSHKEDAQMDKLHKMMPMYAAGPGKDHRSPGKGRRCNDQEGNREDTGNNVRFEKGKAAQKPQGA